MPGTHFPAAKRCLKNLTPGRQGRLRLIAFPHAGGGATAFHPWSEALHQDIELFAVLYPGREERAHEAPVCHPQTLINELLPALLPLQDKPLIFFGHSLGARVALATAFMLPQSPLRLVVSASSTPFRARHAQLLRLPRCALMENLRASGGIPDALSGDSGLLEFYLPLIRADLLLATQILFPQEPGYHAPLAVFYGKEDSWVDRQDLADWRRIAQGDFRQQAFPGGHMYLSMQPESVIDGIHDLLTGHLTGPINV